MQNALAFKVKKTKILDLGVALKIWGRWMTEEESQPRDVYFEEKTKMWQLLENPGIKERNG
jgi:hypothetical protein